MVTYCCLALSIAVKTEQSISSPFCECALLQNHLSEVRYCIRHLANEPSSHHTIWDHLGEGWKCNLLLLRINYPADGNGTKFGSDCKYVHSVLSFWVVTTKIKNIIKHLQGERYNNHGYLLVRDCNYLHKKSAVILTLYFSEIII